MIKKYILFFLLSTISFNYNAYAGDGLKKDNTKNSTQFTKLDYAKLIGSFLGCTWFSIAAGAIGAEYCNKLSEPWHILLITIIPAYAPLGISAEKLLGYDIFTNSKEDLAFQQRYKVALASGALSALLASGLGIYTYKKIAQLRKSKASKELTQE